MMKLKRRISAHAPKTERAVLGPLGSMAFQIYDQIGILLFREGRDYQAIMFEAETLEELATQIGIKPSVLCDIIFNSNAGCPDDVPFDPSKLDGKATRVLAVRKSNWAVPIQKRSIS